MISSDPYGLSSSVARQAAIERRTWQIGYVAMLALGGFLVLLTTRSGPAAFPIAFALLLLVVATWAVRPLVALHFTVFFLLVGDSVSVGWYPMAKNFSSRESILFIQDQLTFSPLDLILGFGMICLLIRRVATGVPILKGPLYKPILAFTGFVILGFFYGIAKGGDSRVAVFEVRPLLYLPLVYILASNYCRQPRHYRTLLWTALAAVVVQSLLSLSFYRGLNYEAKSTLEDLGEHGSAVAMNSVFVLLIVWSLLRECSIPVRIVLFAMTIPVGWAYFLANRRAAVIGLLIGVAMFAVILFWRQKRTFWKFAPIATVILAGYTGAFWNSTAGAGFPAQAIKTVIAPGSVSDKDVSSDIYRTIENKDLNFTIRQNKIMGVGFGNAFYQPIRLPELDSSFEFRNYIPHNSIIWIWLQAGFLGFVAMFYMLGRSLILGASKIRRLPDGPNVAILSSATIFIAMFFVFAFVDIAWDARNTTLLGISFAMCANYPVPRPTVPGGGLSRPQPAVVGAGTSR